MNELIVIDKPRSSFSEEIKRVRTNLNFANVDNNIKVIMITSSLPGEGKTIISSNLAASFAQLGDKTLLIDCDLRRGRLKGIFGITDKHKMGLSNLLIDKEWKDRIADYVSVTEINNLSVMVAGSFPPNPSELLESEKFGELIKILRKQYEVIILDCPPVIGLNDSLIVSNKADATLIVAKSKSTQMDVLEETKKSLEGVGAKITGVILNSVEKGSNDYYSNHYYSED